MKLHLRQPCRLAAAGIATGLVAAALSVGGCSYLSNGASWTKANTPAEEAQADLETCQALAHEQTKKDVDITHDIDAASGGAGSGVPATPDMQGFQTREDYNDILGTCMAELGYSRVK